MALVSITEAAKLVSRGRATLYRDIKNGRLSKSVSSNGETAIETSELVRAYGQLNLPETLAKSHETEVANGIEEFETLTDAWDASHPAHKLSHETSGDKARTQILEERIRSLERILEIEKDLRKVKDQLTDELRARLADKDTVIQTLESKVLLLEYTQPGTAVVEKKRGFWSRFRRMKQR